ncbi:MAG: NAD(+) diphosphatase [Pseudomonadota bacterium]
MMQLQNPNAFAGNPLDRAGNQRRNPDWVRAQRNRPDAQMMVAANGEPLIIRDTPMSKISWLTLEALSLLPGDPELILLGLEDGAPRFAADVTGHEQAFEGLGQFAQLRQATPYLPADELAICGQALWLISWHNRHRHCACHGGPTLMAEGGYKRVNPETGTEHFPRTDPVAIVLPVHGDEVCLGRGPHFPPGFLSTFAGFLEAGETLEECAIREVKEETGLKITKVEYLFSQPWPFPSSLMVGFLAQVTGKDLTLDPEEIVEARWCSKEEILKGLAGDESLGFQISPPFTIAHQLLKEWVKR